MDSMLRVFAIYAFLVHVFRLSGKRTLSEANTFDLLMLLIISETTQQAMVDDDHSMTHAFLLILTLVGIDVALSLLKQRSGLLERLLDDVPLIILENGQPIKSRMDKARVDEGDIMETARQQRGLERLEQIKYAILERNGSITIVPVTSSP